MFAEVRCPLVLTHANYAPLPLSGGVSGVYLSNALGRGGRIAQLLQPCKRRRNNGPADGLQDRDPCRRGEEVQH